MGETIVFVYDASGKLVAEYSTQVEPVETAKVAYLTNDHLGSPRINTDRDGAVTSRHDYHPFGEEIYTAQRTIGLAYDADTIRKQFTGYERDDETGLDFAEARYYYNHHGRFTVPDPILMKKDRQLDPQRINLYLYVRNNPLKFVDSSGEDLILANLAARQTFNQVTLRGLSSQERRNFRVGRDGRVSLVRPSITQGSKNYEDLVGAIMNQNVILKVYTLRRNEAIQSGGLTISGEDAYKTNGIASPDEGAVINVVIPLGGGIPVEVNRNGNLTKESAPEDVIFWHEAIGHGSGNDDEATITIENRYRRSRNPALPERTGSDHRVDAGDITPDIEPITTNPGEITTTISPRPMLPLPKKPEEE
ncbi:MAG: RHS repeat-associated core domain-containing protein [Pyrinomonadaceae bacterium]|nr:RHS repeat-associated core domain-containing protein [Pyrinomonadaceae bacterium]